MVGVALRQVDVWALRQLIDSGSQNRSESCQKVTFAAFGVGSRVVSVFTNKQT